MTAKELKWYRRDKRLGNDVHVVWHSWQKKFIRRNGTYRYKGYQLMQMAERWAKKQPKGFVHLVDIDDSYHSSSLLVIIEHKATKSYMGTTMVVVPQNGVHIEPSEFFLYPNARGHLIQVLRQIRKDAVPYLRSEKKAEQQAAKELRKWKVGST